MRHYYATNIRLRHYYGPTEIHFTVGECSLGSILVAETAKGVCAILLGNDSDAVVRDLQDRFPQARLVGRAAEFEQLHRQGDRLVVPILRGLMETLRLSLASSATQPHHVCTPNL